MKERPILFNDEMARAILEGRKTQTRRVMKVQPNFLHEVRYDGIDDDDLSLHWFEQIDYQGLGNENYRCQCCPYGQVGDRLWVREALHNPVNGDTFNGRYHYSDGKPSPMCNDTGKPRKKPPIHMPRWASRITLEITGVRVERVQDISEADAKAEGVELIGARLVNDDGTTTPYTHRDHFEALWDWINTGNKSWAANPFCWVIEFKRVEQ